MGKTHEALKRAEEEFQENYLPPTREPKKGASTKPPRRTTNHTILETYEDLKTNLFSRHNNGSIKTILFNATSHGSGSSTTAINFSSTLTKDSEIKVLMLDVNLRTPGLHEAFKVDHTLGLSDLLDKTCQMGPQIKKVGPGELHVLTCGDKPTVPLALFESNEFDQFLEEMKEKFDYVILDAPPVTKFSECRVLCTKVDGVVLVIEAGKTRRQVALRAKKELEDAGAKVLGIVLNRRKHYIPEWIYNRL